MSHSTTAERAGWDIASFCANCGFSRATFYNLPDELRPRSLKLGKRHIIIETPAEYLARLARIAAIPPERESA